MRQHQHDKEVVKMPGTTMDIDIRFIYGLLKRRMGDKKSRRIVKAVTSDNWAEAWRQLHRRYIPQSHAIKSKRVREVANYGVKHVQVSHADAVPTIAELEELIDRYIDDYREDPMIEHKKKDAIKQILPRDVERAFNINNLVRKIEDISYVDLKEAIEEFMQEHGPAPGAWQPRRPNTAATEGVDALGESAKGTGAGKGGGGGGGWPGKGAQQRPGWCRCS